MAVILAVAVFLTRSDEGEGLDGSVVTDHGRIESTGELPTSSAPGRETLLDETDRAAVDEAGELAQAEAAGPVARLDDYDHHRVRGRLYTEDGTSLPPDLFVSASFEVPYPRIGDFADLTSGRGNDYDEPDIFDDQEDRLEELTLTPVGSDGIFEMDGVPDGGAFLRVHDDWLYADSPVRMEPGVTFVEIGLERGGRLVGRVVDDAGTPVAMARVVVVSKFNPYGMLDGSLRFAETEDARTDDTGRFELGPVPAGIEMNVKASHSGFAKARDALIPLQSRETREVEITLFDGGRVAGRVVDQDGEPVSDVKVLLRLTTMSMDLVDIEGDTMRETERTNDDGEFEFTGVPPGDYTAALKSSRYLPLATDILEIDHGVDVEDLLLLADRGLTIAGTVLDENGEPLEDAWVLGMPPVSMMDMWGNSQREFREGQDTDENGHFEISGFEPEEIELRISKSGYIPVRTLVDAGVEDQVVEMVRTSNVSGIVVSLIDGEPITVFELKMVPSEGIFDFTDMMGIEDRIRRAVPPKSFASETGEFEMDDVQPGLFDLTVTADGFSITTLKEVEILPGEPTRGIVVMVPAESRVTGRVVSSKTGVPLSGAVVTTGASGMMATMTKSFTGGALETRTDVDGTFSLGGLGRKDLSVTIKHTEHQDHGISMDEPLRAGEVRDLGTIALSAGASVYGHVYDGFEAAARVPVLVSDPMGATVRNATTDDTGYYRVAGLRAGTYNVMRMDFQMTMSKDSSMADFAKDIRFETVTLEKDEEREVDLGDSPDGVTVHGKVRSASGESPTAMVTLMPERGTSGIKFAYTDETGDFELTGVVPGHYTMSTVPIDDGMVGGSQPTASVIKTIHVTDAPRQRHDTNLPGGVMVVKAIADDDGRALSGVRIVLERTDSQRPDVPLMETMGWRMGEKYSGDDGVAHFKHLPDGTYTVVAGGMNLMGLGAKGWGTVRVEDVRVATGEVGFQVQIELPAAGRIDGVVTDPEGKPVIGAAVWAADRTGTWISVLSEVATDSAGRFALENLEEGSWTVAIRDPNWALSLRDGLAVRPGETTSHDVTLQRGVRVTVTTSDVDPWSDLQVQAMGPSGKVPTTLDLSSINDLFGRSTVAGTWDLGRYEPGPYSLLVVQRGKVLMEETVDLSLSRDPHVLTLEAP